MLWMKKKGNLSDSGVDCKVSNTSMFQGENSEGGTFKSQPVQWLVKIV